jgi:histidine ammonia-lyase
MTVVLTGESLTSDEVLRVARGGERVELADAARERMRRAREIVESVIAAGSDVYGFNTGVGVRKRTHVSSEEQGAFNRRLILDHRVGTGSFASRDVVRAHLLRAANGFARGSGPRVEIAERYVAALNDDALPEVRILGSLGLSDLPANADLAHAVLGDLELKPGEALVVLNNNSFSTAIATLALADARRLLETCDVASALDLEAFAANPGSLHPAIADARPYDGLRETLERLRMLLDGSYLWDAVPRALQDPISFRCLPQLHGAARDALAYAERQLAVELNAAQWNPLIIVPEERVVSVGNFDVLVLSAALDFVRIALVPVLTAASERGVKLMQFPLTGLPEGLAAEVGIANSALSEFGVPLQALAAEARTLAQPVSVESASTSHHEGLEDRFTMAPLSGRRLAELVGLGERLVAIGVVLAAQAVDLRGASPLGTGTRKLHELVRSLVAFTGRDDPPPQDLGPLVAALGSS